VPGTVIYVFQADEDWDQTQIDASVPQPFFSVSPIEPPDHMWGEGWLPDSQVQVAIDGFSTTIPTDGDGRFEAMDVGFDIQAGQLVTVSQGDDADYVKTHEVLDLTISDVDAVADTVSGVGAADTLTYVNLTAEDSVVVSSDAEGSWSADLGSEGLDIVPGTVIYVFQADEDWDQTQIDASVPGASLVFNGFAEPVDNQAVNLVTAGRTVPLKFRVTTSDGEAVNDLGHVTVSVITLECEFGTTEDQLEEYASGSSGLQNLGDGYYQYNWKTPKSYQNSCKLLTLDIGDGVPHTAEFTFVR
jgi:hypothetical protein